MTDRVAEIRAREQADYWTCNRPLNQAREDIAWLLAEVERYRLALEKIAANSECSITALAASKHNAFCAKHVALTALAPEAEAEQG